VSSIEGAGRFCVRRAVETCFDESFQLLSKLHRNSSSTRGDLPLMTPDPRPKPSLIVPVLASIVTALSFWIAAASHSWPMAFAGLAAWFLALSYIRLPKPPHSEAVVEVVAFDLNQVTDPAPATPVQRPTAPISR
jgi:hypothetical protein